MRRSMKERSNKFSEVKEATNNEAFFEVNLFS
jgi:hypothetical protein